MVTESKLAGYKVRDTCRSVKLFRDTFKSHDHGALSKI